MDNESRYLIMPAEGDIDEDDGMTKRELFNMLNAELNGHQKPYMLTVALEGQYVPVTLFGYGTDPVDAYHSLAPKNAVAMLAAFEMDEIQYQQMA